MWNSAPKHGQFNFNIPDLPKACIEGLPGKGIAAYRGPPDQAAAFCEALRSRIQEYEHGECFFENVDVSQVAWVPEDFSLLLDVLQENACSANRFKAFKCKLDDEGLNVVAGWLESLDADHMPSEVHLTDNAITDEGFKLLFGVFEGKREDRSEKAPPIWLRVENNKIDEECVKSLAEEDKVVFVNSVRDRPTGSTAVVCMPSHAFRFPKQSAAAPAPAAAAAATATSGRKPPPMVVPMQTQRPPLMTVPGQPRPQTRLAMVAPGTRPVPPLTSPARRMVPAGSTPVMVPHAARWGAQSQARPAQAWGQASRPMLYPSRAAAGRAPAPGGASGASKQVDTGSTPTVARSRSPPRKRPQEPKQKPLPFGWEEHFSEEYQVAYYWNQETDESMWERPS